MTDRQNRTARLRIRRAFWMLNGIGIAALLVFALRGGI